MEIATLILAGCFGLVTGSFLNVVIWRLPRGESVVTPRSRCPGCAQDIAWYDNIPLLSWILLRARCRKCRTPISARYPFVELVTGLLFAFAAWRFGHHLPTAIFVAVALAALLAISAIDWDHKIIPDRITKPGILIAVGLAPLTVLHPPAWIEGLKPVLNAWLHAGTGALAGAAVILAVRWLGTLAFRKEAMGLGDVKLLALIGAMIGPLPVLYALVLACVGGAVIGVLRLFWARGRPLKFPLQVRGEGIDAAFTAAHVSETEIGVEGEASAEVGTAVRLTLQLPAAGILEDEDAEVQVGGRIAAVETRGDTRSWRIELDPTTEEDTERLGMFSMSLRYVPFGPFLALGGAAVLVFGDAVHWWITQGYPLWVRGLLG